MFQNFLPTFLPHPPLGLWAQRDIQVHNPGTRRGRSVVLDLFDYFRLDWHPADRDKLTVDAVVSFPQHVVNTSLPPAFQLVLVPQLSLLRTKHVAGASRARVERA